ncbi:hypothetical protein T552_02353 [Pneumocystis carinii B80]|uniref:Uncharacterized protein n=1 Tax=Pneumocystis carinii (strain B80) TaxID=1408658 RepID=A0A0W4ZG59_PNEC8|nr:hypothetical protein T552_02353 [Pneumocystis carinii B80]KTW27374.1 hypothetical protein T552_02353 [Pneumocystis carinii B80]
MRQKLRQKGTSTVVEGKMGVAKMGKVKNIHTSSMVPSLPRKRGRPSKKQEMKTEERMIEVSKKELKEIQTNKNNEKENLTQKQIKTPISNKERGLSVSLVVGKSGIARVVQGEIEVASAPQENIRNGTGLMERVLSTQAHRIPCQVEYKRPNDSLAFITDREGYVRVEPLNGILSPQLPTPMDSDFYMDMKGRDMMNIQSLLSPESQWESSGDDITDEEDIMDARVAMKKLIDKRRTVGLGLDEFLGSDVLNTPSFRVGKRQRKLSCKACHMTFRQLWVLHAHEKKCNIKQTPFLSSDYFDDTIEDTISYFHEDARSEQSISSPILPESIPLSKFIEHPTQRKNILSS